MWPINTGKQVPAYLDLIANFVNIFRDVNKKKYIVTNLLSTEKVWNL